MLQTPSSSASAEQGAAVSHLLGRCRAQVLTEGWTRRDSQDGNETTSPVCTWRPVCQASKETGFLSIAVERRDGSKDRRYGWKSIKWNDHPVRQWDVCHQRWRWLHLLKTVFPRPGTHLAPSWNCGESPETHSLNQPPGWFSHRLKTTSNPGKTTRPSKTCGQIPHMWWKWHWRNCDVSLKFNFYAITRAGKTKQQRQQQ